MPTSGQVIIHLDLDCFYCQVEQKRLGLPREVPAAVQQWDGLIAINYAARALGVTRHMRVMQAMQFCPELRCIHVQTLGGETGKEGVEGPVNSGLTHPNDRLLQKACLERYRRASVEIIALIRSIIPKAPLEKASIDEVFVDVTELVEKELEEREDQATSEHAPIDAFAWGSVVEGGPLCPENEYDRRLSVGANIACRLRGAIRDKLDFTSSAGIAHTKMIAKVGSARNKPDQQTIIAARGIAGLMADLPLKKLRNFGGKLGEELKALGATTAGQVAAIPLNQLQNRFGERAKWILDCVTGQHSEPVTVRDLSKSMLAAKTFGATSDMEALKRWLGILADELSDRMMYDAQLNQRFPRNLVLSYRQAGSGAGRSKSCAMPKAPAPGPTAAMLQEAGMCMLQKCADALPCSHLGLSATEFQDTPGDEQGCITRFFQSRPQQKQGDTHGTEAARQQAPGPARQNSKLKPRAATIQGLFLKAGASTPAAACGSPSRMSENAQAARTSTQPIGASVPCPAPPSEQATTQYPPNGCDNGAQPAIQTASAQPVERPLHNAADDPGTLGSSRQAIQPANTDVESAGVPRTRTLPWSVDCVESRHVEQSEQSSTGGVAESEYNDRRTPQSLPEATGNPCRQPQDAAMPPDLPQHPHHGNLRQSGQEPADTSASAMGLAPSDMGGSVDVDVLGIDLAEQQKILKEIWVQKSRVSKPTATKRPALPDRERAPKQPRLTDMFTKRTH